MDQLMYASLFPYPTRYIVCNNNIGRTAPQGGNRMAALTCTIEYGDEQANAGWDG